MNWLIEFIFPHQLRRFAYFLRVVAINITLDFLGTCPDFCNFRFWIQRQRVRQKDILMIGATK